MLDIFNKATKVVHLTPCQKNIIAIATVKLLWHTVVKLDGNSRVIYSDKGAQFTVNSWQVL